MTSPVPDVRTVQAFKAPYYQVTIDWSLLGDGTLDDSQALATGVVVALGTDALADPTDELPDPNSTNRAGWWGDLDCDVIWNGWPIGSKVWLYRRSAILPAQARLGSTVMRIKNAIYAAIQPFVDARIASTFDLYVERVDKQRIDALLQIFKGPTLVVDLRYSILWDELQQQSTMNQ
jgi:phage gp46-like protein